jgi:hypothetical protein
VRTRPSRRFAAGIASTSFALHALGCTGDDVIVYRAHDVSLSTGGAGGDDVASGGASLVGQGMGETPPGRALASGGQRAMPPDASSPPSSGGTPGSGGRSAATGGRGAQGGGAGGTTGSTGGGTGLLHACSTASECPSGFICLKLDCVNPMGFCEPHPLPCDPSALPVCGCDGVTYWNDCYRQESGVGTSALAQCTGPLSACNTAADCKATGASCAHLGLGPGPGQNPGTCGPPAPGTCWVAPPDCAATPSAPLWTVCDPQQVPGQPPRSSCMNTCDAIRSGQPVVSATPSVQCR